MAYGRRSRSLSLRPCLVVLLLAASGSQAWAASRPAIRARDLEGRPRTLSDLAGRVTVLILVRSDCGPCRLELRDVEQIEAAARPARVVLLAVENNERARDLLLKTNLPRADLWRAETEPREVLIRLNGPPPRLPLSVALDRRGAVCARHVGLLGSDRVGEWVRQCS